MGDRYSALNWFDSLHQAITSTRARCRGKETGFEDALEETAGLLEEARQRDASVWWVGNGGSAAICSHLSQDMLNKLDMKSLYCGDSSMMTCMANDFGYENVYAHPLAKLVKKGDLLIAISSSGNSDNILACTALANEKEMDVITLSGFSRDNRLWNATAGISFFVSSDLYGIVEMAHEAILHGIIETAWLNSKQEKTT